MRQLLTAMMIASVLLVASAAAQDGPAPGYDSSIEYAFDHAQDEASAAADAPDDYAASKASEDGLRDEFHHTAYVSCWVLDDVGIETTACDPYYIARGDAGPEHHHEEPEIVEEAQNVTEDAVNATEEFVAEVYDIVTDNSTDTESLLERLTRAQQAVETFAQAIVDAVLGFGASVAEFGVATLEHCVVDPAMAIGESIGSAGSETLDAAEAVQEELVATADNVTAQASAAINETKSSIEDTLEDSSSDPVASVSDLSGGLKQALQESFDEFQQVVKDAVDALADAAASLREALAGLLDDPASAADVDSVSELVPSDEVNGLVDGVLEIIE